MVHPNKVDYTDYNTLTTKQKAWLAAYCDSSNKSTYLNKRQSALRAYDCTIESASTIGVQNFVKLKHFITEAFDNVLLSENELQARIVKGLNVKETKLFHNAGEIIESEPRDCIGEQRRYLDMAIKVRGMYKDTEKPVVVNSINMYAELSREELVQITDAIVAKREAAKQVEDESV